MLRPLRGSSMVSSDTVVTDTIVMAGLVPAIGSGKLPRPLARSSPDVTRPVSAGFHWQRWIARPFRQRRVVQLHVVMTEHDERQGIRTRRDAAAAVVDHLPVHGADRFEALAEFVG